MSRRARAGLRQRRRLFGFVVFPLVHADIVAGIVGERELVARERRLEIGRLIEPGRQAARRAGRNGKPARVRFAKAGRERRNGRRGRNLENASLTGQDGRIRDDARLRVASGQYARVDRVRLVHFREELIVGHAAAHADARLTRDAFRLGRKEAPSVGRKARKTERDLHEFAGIALDRLRHAVDESERLIEIRIRDLADRGAERAREKFRAGIVEIDERVHTAHGERRAVGPFRIARLKNQKGLAGELAAKRRPAVRAGAVRHGHFGILVQNLQFAVRTALFTDLVRAVTQIDHRNIFVAHRAPQFDDRIRIGEEEVEQLGIAAAAAHRETAVERRRRRQALNLRLRRGRERVPRNLR